jgi:MFS family permease
MIQNINAGASAALPSLWPALAAMTALQALVALALFAPGVLAPSLGLGVAEVGLFTTTVFAVGMATSLVGGKLARQFGPCVVATGCAIAVACGMGLASVGGLIFLVLAGLVVGLAFGPETPASSTLLSSLATPAQRPLIFSVRQTGNQIGAIIGSLSLPLIALQSPTAGYVIISAIAIVAAVTFALMRRKYDPISRGAGQSLDIRDALRAVGCTPALRALALASIPFSAMQMALNAFMVTFAVTTLSLSHIDAGVLLGTAQGGGLFGRLSWGLIASKTGRSRYILIGIGIGMSIVAVTLALVGSQLSFPALAMLAFLFGLTASGWNGVFLAEVARLSPPGRVAEITGAVLTASYAGLLIGPSIVALVAMAGTLALSYVTLAACATIATLHLVRSDHDTP